MRTQFNLLAIIYNTIRYLNYAFKVDIYLTQQYWIDISVYISLSAILNRYICVLCHRGFVKNYLFHSSGYWQDSGYNNYVTALNFPQYCKILRGYKSFICCIPTNNDKHYTVLFLWNQFSSYISWACSMWYFANLANLFEKYLWFLKQYFNPENILNYILRHNTYQYDNYLWLTVLPKQWLSI